MFKLFDQVWAKENYGDIIDGHHPFRHCQQICSKLSNLLSRSHLLSPFILYQEYGQMKEVSEDINTITLFLGVFLCAFMSLAYGTVMYVWMMEHCDGELFPSTLQFLFLNVFLLQVKSRLCLEPVLTTTLDFGA